MRICHSQNYFFYITHSNQHRAEIIEGFDNGNFEKLENFSEKTTDVYKKSVSKRILAIQSIQAARDTGIELNINKVWKWIYQSLEVIPKIATISSIGSQGFLSIPLYKYEKEMDKFDFIRLHIWDKSLDQYFDKKKSETFSVHTHSFLAQSWVLVGKIVNNRYRVKENSKKANASLFTIEYNKTLNQVNQHTSVAKNTGKNVNVEQISNEVYLPYSTYKIKKENYHQSISLGKNGLSSTIFSFTSKDGIAKKSFVVGPMDIEESKINRKMHIDATYLINQLNSIVKDYE